MNALSRVGGPSSHAPTRRLVCFPYAGGSQRTFASWPGLLGGTEVLVANLPGRGRRFAEAPTTDASTVTRAVAEHLDQIHPPGDVPLQVFGHSMGAYLAFDLVVHLEAAGQHVAGLVVSGALAPPSMPVGTAPLEDSEVLEAMRAMGATPPEFFASPDLVSLFLPVLRADFHLAASYWAPPDARVSCPLHELRGRLDPATPPHLSSGWAARADGPHHRSSVDGDHFFVDSHPRCTTDLLAAIDRPNPRRATG